MEKKRRKQITEKALQNGLTDKELKFCELFANNFQLRGNGVRCYGEAFKLNLANPKNYNTAKANSHKLLTQPEILKYIRSIFEAHDLSEESILGELAFVIKQNSDFPSKVQASKLVLQIMGKLKPLPATAVQFNITMQNTEGENL